MSGGPGRVLRWTDTDREIARLAVPALGALIAEPLYLLADTAVVGNLGTSQLGGLALASQALLSLHALSLFLAYGTTAAVSRLLGAGQRDEAAFQAVQSIWLAAAIGVVGGALLWVVTDPVLEVLGGEGDVLTNARVYLRVSLPGLPAMLISLACVGYLRGLQDTVRPLIVAIVTAVGNLVLELVLIYGFDQGIGASALSTVAAQWIGAGLFLRWVLAAVRDHGVSLMPDPGALRRQLVVAGDLFLRTAALRGSFTVAVAAAARLGDTELAAHEIALQLWFLMALSLDAIAIAGQAIVGRHLGAGDVAETRLVANRMLQWGLATGALSCVILLSARPWLPGVFSGDDAVVSLAGFLILHLALMGPLSGVVFTLDGILMGAGDMRFLAIAMTGAAALFVPTVLAVPAFDWGIGWVWGAIWLLMLARAIPLGIRVAGDAWLKPGAT
ncbi:MAG: MATE family efflux transporter [Actinomycetota bacterium]